MTGAEDAISGRVDHDGCLLGGDAEFMAMIDRAGGRTGHRLPIAQFLAVARLVTRLDIRVERAVTFVDNDEEVDCRIRADPTGECVDITIVRDGGWGGTRRHDVTARIVPPAGADWEWEVDATLRVRRIAIAAGSQFGFDATAALGYPLTKLVDLVVDGEGALPILEALAARSAFGNQMATLRATGRVLRLAGTPRLLSGNRFGGFVGGSFMSDDSRDRSAMNVSRHFNSRLDKALRVPLGRIVERADRMSFQAEGFLDAHYTDYAADIANAGRHLISLVDDLVDLEAIERDDFIVGTEVLDLADIARRASGLLKVRAADAGVTIEPPDSNPRVVATGEFRRTLQILVNLVGNAIRYAPRGTSVLLRAQRDSDRAFVIVADAGKGIERDDLARIFDKFVRIDDGEAGGSGLGLYIGQRLARAMGGDLTVDSAPGEGARFILSLPAVDQTAG